MKQSRVIKNKFSPLTATLLSVLVAYALFMLLMLFWALLTASKSYTDYAGSIFGGGTNHVGWPKKNVLWDNLKTVNTIFVDITLMKSAWYTLLYAGGCALIKCLVTCVVAYLCARYKNWFSQIVYITVIVTMIVPVVGSQAAEIQMARDLQLYNKIWGMWIMRANFLGMYFLVFYAVFASMPSGYYEAARIDGANDMQVMCRIAMPLVKYTFWSIFLIIFIEYWNDYMIPNYFLDDYPTLSLLLYRQSIDQVKDEGGSPISYSAAPFLMATTLWVAVPVIIFFSIFSKRLMGNLSVGGLKG
ncbi:MAG: carbohydrate ABC transporter permease [Clostridia bacterium]|nr:carbohydrate ABC transporter permease [Clostridia bacterium]